MSGGQTLSDRLRDGKGAYRNLKPPTDAVSKYKALQQQNRPNTIDWTDAPHEDLMAAIVAVTGDGAAILLSRTSDGGALVIRVIDGNTSTPFYPSNAGALNEVLSMIVDAAANA